MNQPAHNQEAAEKEEYEYKPRSAWPQILHIYTPNDLVATEIFIDWLTLFKLNLLTLEHNSQVNGLHFGV